MLPINIPLAGKTVLITGAAGFIGASLVRKLLAAQIPMTLVGVDDLNAYYDIALKQHRLDEIERLVASTPVADWVFVKGSVADRAFVEKQFAMYTPDVVVHLAAQAGVRFSISHPDAYIESNLIGFYHILEACRHAGDRGGGGVAHFIYASSSSVYGANREVPYREGDLTDAPVSLYAATKKSNELMAHAYAKLYDIPATGLRFFTVYGPAGRPDMAYYSFTDKLIHGECIDIFNYGDCRRDFTYVEDVTEGLLRVMERAPVRACGDDGLPLPPHAVYNIGNSHPVSLREFVTILAEELVRVGLLPMDFDPKAHMRFLPMQPGDVPITFADTSALARDTGFAPQTELREGLGRFAAWYRDFHGERARVMERRA